MSGRVAADISMGSAQGARPGANAYPDERSTRLAQALLALGYGGVVTHSNITGAGIIQAWVGKTPGLSTDPDEIKALLPADLAPFVVLTVRLSPNERLLPSTAP